MYYVTPVTAPSACCRDYRLTTTFILLLLILCIKCPPGCNRTPGCEGQILVSNITQPLRPRFSSKVLMHFLRHMRVDPETLMAQSEAERMAAGVWFVYSYMLACLKITDLICVHPSTLAANDF